MIQITKDMIKTINDTFSEEDKQTLLHKIHKYKKRMEINSKKKELMKKLAENSNIDEIEELTNTIYVYNPIQYKFKDKDIAITIEKEDRICIAAAKKDEETGCVFYKYIASSMDEVIDLIDEIHYCLSIGAI